MQQLEAVRKKIATTGDLLSVVKTMKALAAVNIRHFENAARESANMLRSSSRVDSLS